MDGRGYIRIRAKAHPVIRAPVPALGFGFCAVFPSTTCRQMVDVPK